MFVLKFLIALCDLYKIDNVIIVLKVNKMLR